MRYRANRIGFTPVGTMLLGMAEEPFDENEWKILASFSNGSYIYAYRNDVLETKPKQPFAPPFKFDEPKGETRGD